MKKALFIMFALVLVAVVAAPAMAQTRGWITFGFATIGGGTQTCTYGLSNNVYMSYTPGNNGQDYAIGDKHLSGNREFYTTNVTTNIYYFEDNTFKGQTTLSNAALLSSFGASSLAGTAL